MTRVELLQKLVEIEDTIRYRQAPPPGKAPFVYRPGTIPVLISAPHATAHRRHGRFKGEEEFTAALAVLLGRATGAHALYTRYRTETDPNWDANAPYKTLLRRVVQQQNVRFVLDLHGMSNRHKIGMALGTMNGRSCPRREGVILQAWQAHNFSPAAERDLAAYGELRWNHFVLNHSRFTGGLINHTVTRFAAETLGVAAAQIELCSAVRVVRRGPLSRHPRAFQGDPQGIAQTFRALTATIQAVARF